VPARLRTPLIVLFGSVVLSGQSLSASATVPPVDPNCSITSVSFTVNGAPAPLVAARRGDHVEVTFDVPMGCSNRITFASFVAPAPAPALDGSRLDEQVAFSKQTDVFRAGRHSLAIDVFSFPGSATHDCASAPLPLIGEAGRDEIKDDVRDLMAASPEYRDQVLREMRAKAASAQGANQSGPYDSTCDGSASQNGVGDGAAVGKPCAGCVGDADDKNPPGQLPGGNDPNAGYECDRNQGVGPSNPAHSGCQNFQLDLSYRPAVAAPGQLPGHPTELIAAVFCLSTTPVCFTTDRTLDAAVMGP
jgi:hypothetical protein